MEKSTEKITRNIIKFLQMHDLLKKETTLFVAFSGGADSLSLLDVLYEIRSKYGFRLAAGHLNHNWRGEESIREAEKAKKYCKNRNIEFYMETLPPELPQTEEEARNQRYKFLNKIAEKIKANAILTGHTQTDNVETVLYRIIKGTGIAGLKGIPEIRRQKNLSSIYRPMLSGILREDCIQYCKENSLSASVDPSNFDEKYLRNRIRHSLLPELRTYNTAVDSSLLKLSQIARDSEEITGEYLANIRKDMVFNNEIINTKKFINLSIPLQRRLLVDFLDKNLIEHTFERIEGLFRFIEENSGSKSGKTFSIAKNLWFFVSSKELKLIRYTKAPKSETSVPVSFEGEFFHPELEIILKIEKWHGITPEKFPKETDDIVFADLSKLKEPLYLRTRKPGDIIQPFGMKEKTKLKKYLINRGIPKYTRDTIPLLADKEEVLWVAGVGISELLRVKKIPTHVIGVKTHKKQ